VAVSPRDADEVAQIALSGSVALVLDSPSPNGSVDDRPTSDGPAFDDPARVPR